jgi:hypothetical protein
MIDMKLSPAPKKGQTMLGSDTELEHPEQPEYPYGLRVRLDNDSLKKLGITEMPAIDAEFKLTALVCVVEISQSDSQNSEEPYRSLELQIEQMELKPAAEEPGERTAAERMYG